LRRRVDQMKAEGVIFRTEVEIGVNVEILALVEEFDAVAMTDGAEAPRDLEVPAVTSR
jgi:glutamate synthase (NADPH/NADH) small chain